MTYRISATPGDGIQVLEIYEPIAEGWYTVATLHEPCGKRDMEAILAAAEREQELRKALKRIGDRLDGDNISADTWRIQVNGCHDIIDAVFAQK